MLDIGKFDRKIIIQVGYETIDTMGGAIFEWEDYLREYAFVEWKGGKSDDDQDRVYSTMSVEFTIRNISHLQQSITANKFRVAFPTLGGASIPSVTQFYTITGIKLYGGRDKYKVMITELNTNEFAVK